MTTPTQNSISAADTSIGFDYQFYYFFYLLLDLRHGQKIGLEVKDDIHIDFEDGESQLIQTKHSVQTNSDGQIINLTERDLDLWKTISNWVSMVKESTNPTQYLSKTTFQLITNKNNRSNPFFQSLSDFKKGAITAKQFKEYLKKLYETTSDVTIKGYINVLQKLAITTLTIFCRKIGFELTQDNLIQRIKDRILEKIHFLERVEDIYASLHSALRDKNYLSVKAGDKIEISFKDFNQGFKYCFKSGLSKKLPIREFNISFPTDPAKQLFIQQLIDIEVIDRLNNDDIRELTTHMLMIYNNLHRWEMDGDIGSKEKTQLQSSTILRWKNSFQSKYREIKRRYNSGETVDELADDILYTAQKCLDELRKEILIIDETQLDTQHSNGYFYLLTEDGHIGWHFDWKNKYGQ